MLQRRRRAPNVAHCSRNTAAPPVAQIPAKLVPSRLIKCRGSVRTLLRILTDNRQVDMRGYCSSSPAPFGRTVPLVCKDIIRWYGCCQELAATFTITNGKPLMISMRLMCDFRRRRMFCLSQCSRKSGQRNSNRYGENILPSTATNRQPRSRAANLTVYELCHKEGGSQHVFNTAMHRVTN